MNNPIGIFDSGIGGVTVLKEIIKILPNEDYIFYSDSENNPYGNKNEKDIIKISEEIVIKLLKKECKAIVIACNTASAITAEYLRSKYKNVPIIAIEPAYKMVYDNAYYKPTLIMATEGTIKSEKFNLLYEKYNNHKTYLLPCAGLADAIESDNKKEIMRYLEENLESFKGKIKNIVLGCTHYPLIKNEIKEVLGDDIEFFDGAKGVAKHLKEILKQKKILEEEKKSKVNIIFIDSNKDKEKSNLKKERFFKYLKS